MFEQAEPPEMTGETATCRCGGEIEKVDAEDGTQWVHSDREDCYKEPIPEDVDIPDYHPISKAGGFEFAFYCEDGELAWPEDNDEEKPDFYQNAPEPREIIDMFLEDATADDDDPMIM